MTVQLFLLLCYLFCGSVVTATTAGSNTGLTTITGCRCPGYYVVYECTVTGGVFTVWGGSAFQCAGNEITLSNSEFGSDPPPAAVCNSGNIIGRGITQQNNFYTSQLNITLSEDLIGRTVTCGIDNGAALITVDNIAVTTSSRPLSAPKNISMNITSNRITFMWDHVARNCPGLYYNVTSMGCGVCPSETDVSMISCSNFMTPTNCTLLIETVTCWRTSVEVSGNSTSLSLFLKVPEAPDLTVVPYYNHEHNELIGIYTEFSKNQFMISDSVDGSPIFYNITYTDFSGRTTCDSVKILTNSSSCNTETCSHYFSGICSSTDFMVTVFGVNMLGSGASSRTTIDDRNNFVTIQFELTSSLKEVRCIFREQTSNVPLMCRISIATESSYQNLRGIRSEMGARNSMAAETVIINLEGLIGNMDDGKDLYFTITASNGIKQVVIQDIVSVSIDITDRDSETNINIAAIVVPIILILAITVVAVVILAILLYIMVFKVIPKLRSETVKDISSDCKPLLLKEGESLSMDECGKKLVGENYDPSSGQGYYLADPDEEVPSDANVIARSEDDKQYKTGSDVHKKLIENGKVLPSNRREEEYRRSSVFVQSRSKERIIKAGSEFVHCKVSINDRLQEEDPSTLPEGVVASTKWYYMYEIPNNMPLEDFCKIIGRELPNDETSTLFYEKHETEETESKEDQGEPSQVMALRTNKGQLFEDGSKTLYREAKFIDTKYGRKVLRPSGWEHLFIRLSGVTVIRGGSKLLYCDEKHGPVLVSKPFEIYEVTTDDKDKKISELLRKSPPFVQFELKTGKIYMEIEVAEAINKSPDKLMALDKNWKLCTGQGIRRLLGPIIDRERIWKSIFVQVTTDKYLGDCKSILYCKTYY